MRFELSIYRYNPSADGTPRTQDYTLEAEEDHDMMLLDALIQLKEKDPSLSLHRPCREGVCSSDGLNMNGKNGLACITPILVLNQLGKKIVVRPLPGLPMIRDLVVDMGQFYVQCGKIKPYLLSNEQNPLAREHLQTSEQRGKLDGLHGCILYAYCSTPHPSFQWNPDKSIDPAGLLTVYRFLIDNRGTETDSRLDSLNDAFSAFRCHSIMSYVSVCPRGLSPTRTIGHIKSMLLQRNVQTQV